MAAYIQVRYPFLIGGFPCATFNKKYMKRIGALLERPCFSIGVFFGEDLFV